MNREQPKPRRVDPRMVERIYDEAVELPALQREAFLGQACGDDKSLRSEVESLLGWTSGDPADEPQREDEIPESVGRYRDLTLLGRGGMGIVYKAYDPVLCRHVALKVLRGAGLIDKRRMLAEAKAQARVDHENVCTVFEAGESGGTPYIAMDLIDGGRIDKLEGLSIESKVELVRKAALAIHEAHRQGLVHRDVKPGNILVKQGADSGWVPFVVDFGLARKLDRKAETVSGLLAGTPAYMAPEQAATTGQKLDARCDVYGLGATLYHLLAGRPPFTGDSLEVLLKVAGEDPEPLGKAAPEIPKDLATVVMKCLERSPQRRYPSALALAEELGRFLCGEEVEARPLGPVERTTKWLARHRAAVHTVAATLGILLLALFLLAGLPWLVAYRSDHRAIEKALAAKHERERRFRNELQAGKLDQAIVMGDRLFGRTPPAPVGLAAPGRLASYPELSTSYAVDLPAAFLARGMLRLARSDRKGRIDLANAFRTAVSVGEKDTGRRALVALAGDLLDSGDLEGGAAILQTARNRFGDSPALLANLARVFERKGRAGAALACYRKLTGDPQYGREAHLAARMFEKLLPGKRFHMNKGATIAADLTGDGRAEIVHQDRAGLVTVYRLDSGRLVKEQSLKLPREKGITARGLAALDLDGDGQLEIVTAPGDGFGGSLYVLSYGHVSANDKEGLRLRATDDLGAIGGPFLLGDFLETGERELLVNIQHYQRKLRLYGYRNGRLTRLFEEPIGVDVAGMATGPYGPDGAPRLLLALSNWKTDRGYRLALYPLDPYQWQDGPLAVSEERLKSASLVAMGGPAVAVAAAIDSAVERLVPGLLPTGLYTTELCADRIGPLAPLGSIWGTDEAPAPAILMRDGTAVTSLGDLLYLFRRDSAWVHELQDGPGDLVNQSITEADLDGDGDGELAWQRRDGLLVFGLTGEPWEPEIPPADAAGATSRGTPGDDLLEAGLYLEARDLFSRRVAASPTPDAYYGLAKAEAGLGRYRPAADAFSRVQGSRELEIPALRGKAMALERLREWKRLAPLLASLAANPRLGAMERLQTRQWHDWIAKQAKLAPRIDLSAFRQGDPLGCMNPLLARIDNGRLHLVMSRSCISPAGLFLWHAGGPIRLTVDLTMTRPAWATSVRIGIASSDILRCTTTSGAGEELQIDWSASGATAIPRYHAMLDYNILYGPQSTFRSSDVDIVPAEKRPYRIVIESVPGRGEVLADITDKEAGTVLASFSLAARPFAEPGTCIVGAVGWQMAVPASDEFVTDVWLHRIRIDAASPLTRSTRPPTGDGRSLLALANGETILGDFDQAMRDYAKAIRIALATGDTDGLWRAWLFQAFCNTRRGRLAKARKDLARALRIHGNRVLVLLDAGGAKLYPDAIAKMKAMAASLARG